MTRIIEKANAHGKTSIDELGTRWGQERHTRAHEAFLAGAEMPHNPNWGVGEVPKGDSKEEEDGADRPH